MGAFTAAPITQGVNSQKNITEKTPQSPASLETGVKNVWPYGPPASKN